MMARCTVIAMVCLLLYGTIATAQDTTTQDTIIFGRVIGSNHIAAIPQAWVVSVTAKVDGMAVPVKHDSEHELYVIRVPRDKRVTLFWESNGYECKNKKISTADKDKREAYRQDITLNQILKARAAPLPRKAEIKQRVAEARDTAKETQNYDILAYNLSAYKTAYPEFKDDVEEARKSILASTDLPEQARVALGDINDRVYQQIAFFNADPDEKRIWHIDVTSLRKLHLPSGIKYQFYQQLANVDAADRENFNHLLADDFANPGSKNYWAAVGVKAKWGDKVAQQHLFSYFTDENTNSALQSIQCVGAFQIYDGNAVLLKTIKEGTTPELRVAAIQSKRKLGKIDDATIDALIEKLERDKNASVRVEAVKSLRMVGDNSKVQAALKAASEKDTSPEVREAALLKNLTVQEVTPLKKP